MEAGQGTARDLFGPAPFGAGAGDGVWVNFKTANRAVAFLAKERVLESRPGRGTHVALGEKEIAEGLRQNAMVKNLALFFTPSSAHLYGEHNHPIGRMQCEAGACLEENAKCLLLTEGFTPMRLPHIHA